MLRTLLDVLLCSTLPALLTLLAMGCVLLAAVGIDQIAELDVLSNALLAALFGVEIGIPLLVLSCLAVAALLFTRHAVVTQHVRRLQWGVTALLVLLLALASSLVTLQELRVNVALDPALLDDTVRGRFVRLDGATLVQLETAMQCCGFDDERQGACTDVTVDVPTCRASVQRVLDRELQVWETRTLASVVALSVAIAMALVLSLRWRRFNVKPRIEPATPPSQSSPTTPPPPPTFLGALVEQSAFLALLALCLSGAVLGIVVLSAGFDALYQLNVLHVSFLLRVVDRRVGVFLLALGGGLELVSWLGVIATWRRSRRLAALFLVVCSAAFVVVLGVAGVSFRVAHGDQTIGTTAHSLNERLESVWRGARPSDRVFAQNALVCCGFDRVRLANGSTTFTLQGARAAWSLETESDAALLVVTDASAGATRRLSSVSVERRVVRRLQLPECPESATDGCAPALERYVSRLSLRALRLSIIVLAALSVCILSTIVLHWPQPSATTAADRSLRSTRVKLLAFGSAVARGAIVVLSLASLLVALACFFLGLDMAAHWSLFTASLVQLLFPRSIGAALLIYATVGVALNVYTLQGVAHRVVHRVAIQSALRVALVLCGWLCVALTAYLSRFSASSHWRDAVTAFLDRQWDTLTPALQHRVAADYRCCGFEDPVFVKGRGVVFDRPAVGFPPCALTISRGCRHALEAQLSSSLAGLFQLALALTLLEMTLLAASALVLRELRTVKPHEWFVVESRVRYAIGRYRRDVQRRHVALSVVASFDEKLRRPQRVTSVACALATTLAILSMRFARYGCHRHALRTCVQPDAWGYAGMALLYGGVVGLAAQTLAKALFESVRHRCDDESDEVAAARQRKEKVLVFRNWFARHKKTSSITSGASKIANTSSSSSMEATRATTEERWYHWLQRAVDALFRLLALALFVAACGFATFFGLVLLGYRDKLYGVRMDHGVVEALSVSLLVALTSLVAWLALDLKDRPTERRRHGAIIALLVVVALASVALLIAVIVGVVMASQTLDDKGDDPSVATANWTIPQHGLQRRAAAAGRVARGRERLLPQRRAAGATLLRLPRRLGLGVPSRVRLAPASTSTTRRCV
ncbi:hypothetical protein PINS_up005465 [Pythium insidiosum]|nr:hypothetical protein PINS_up005465 [Pythium insidiosum]